MEIVVTLVLVGIAIFVLATFSIIVWAAYQVLKAFGHTLLTRNGFIAFMLLFTPVSPIGAVWLVMMVIRNLK